MGAPSRVALFCPVTAASHWCSRVAGTPPRALIRGCWVFTGVPLAGLDTAGRKQPVAVCVGFFFLFFFFFPRKGGQQSHKQHCLQKRNHHSKKLAWGGWGGGERRGSDICANGVSHPGGVKGMEVDEGGEVMAEPGDDVISHAGIPLQMLVLMNERAEFDGFLQPEQPLTASLTNVTANDSSAGGGGKGPDGRYFGQKVDQDQDSAPLLCVSFAPPSCLPPPWGGNRSPVGQQRHLYHH